MIGDILQLCACPPSSMGKNTRFQINGLYDIHSHKVLSMRKNNKEN